MTLQTELSTSSIAITPHQSWRNASHLVAVLIGAGAWRTANVLAAPLVRIHWQSLVAPPAFYELLGLYLISSARLDHLQQLNEAMDWVERICRSNVQLSREADVLLRYLLARCHADRGDYEHALADIRAIRVAHASPATRSRVALLTARILARRGDLPAAMDSAGLACRLAASADTPALEGDCYVALANVLSLKRDFDGAQKTLDCAARAYWKASDSSGRAMCLTNQASQYLHLGRPGQAKAVLEDAIRLSKDSGRSITALAARIASGWLAALESDLKGARRFLLPSMREARRNRLPREEALCLEYLADAYLQVGNEPLHLCRAAIAVRLLGRIATRLSARGDLALEWKLRRAKLLLSVGEYRECLDMLDSVIRSARQQEMPWEEAQGLRLKGTALFHLGMKRDAVAAFSRALAVFEGLGECLESRLIGGWLAFLDSEGTQSTIVDENLSSGLCAYFRHPVFAPWSEPRGLDKLTRIE